MNSQETLLKLSDDLVNALSDYSVADLKTLSGNFYELKAKLKSDIVQELTNEIIKSTDVLLEKHSEIFPDEILELIKKINLCNLEIEKEYEVEKAVETKKENVKGVFELNIQSGYGFLRPRNYEPSRNDVFIPKQTVRYYNLRTGDFIECNTKEKSETGNLPIDTIFTINGRKPEEMRKRRGFDFLTPLYPQEKLIMESKVNNNLSLRCLDLIAPIGKGQRGLIVSPPKAGKTSLLKLIAQSIEENHPEVKLIVLLIDERPEEVTDLQRSIKSEVAYSTFDEEPAHHVRVARLVIERAKRLVELGEDVVILLDSITRLARANNYTIESSGRTLSGGIDPAALIFPKQFLGSARNIENGGSLSIIATALVDTGSRMDDFIYEEFKGTGNMEIHLSRELQEKRIFPAIDLLKSGTRKEEMLLSKSELECSFNIRKLISVDGNIENILEMMSRTKDNNDFVSKMPEWIKVLNNSTIRKMY